MPIYDYVCQSCGTRIEVIHGVHAAGPDACAQCGGTLRRALSVPAIHFKGSGWAKMDARSSTGKSEPGSKPAGEGAAAADSKPASDTDSRAGKHSTADTHSTADRHPTADKPSAADQKTTSNAASAAD